MLISQMLELRHLRQIGRRLRDLVLRVRHSKEASEPLGRGAGGDRTLGIDRLAEEAILEGLESLRIGLSVVSEEKGVFDLYGGGEMVIIDPLDGSKNAASGLPLFTVSIAVSETERLSGLRLGYIINPISSDEFWAERMKGAFLNGRPIRTDPSEKIKVVLYETQVPERDIPRAYPLLKLANRTRCLGTTAMDLALIAMGAASVYINPVPTRCFDYAAGILIVREAGGLVSDALGGDFFSNPISMERTPPLLVSANEAVHQIALRQIGQEARGWMN